MEHKMESENRRLSRHEEAREREIERIRREDPGFIPPEHQPRSRRGAGFWMWIGVGVLIILLLIWLSVAMFTGDTDVNLITPFPWV